MAYRTNAPVNVPSPTVSGGKVSPPPSSAQPLPVRTASTTTAVGRSPIPSGSVPQLPTTGQPGMTAGVPVVSTQPFVSNQPLVGGDQNYPGGGIAITVPGSALGPPPDDGKILGLPPMAALAIGISGAVIITVLLLRK